MKDTYRQLILLVGVMSILVSGLTAFNSTRQERSTDGAQEAETGQQEVDLNNSSTDGNITSAVESASNSSNILLQSIGGLIALWGDLQAGRRAIAGSASGS